MDTQGETGRPRTSFVDTWKRATGADNIWELSSLREGKDAWEPREAADDLINANEFLTPGKEEKRFW